MSYYGRIYLMAPIDFICIGIMVLFGLIGLWRGLARQLMTLFCWFFSLIAAIALVPIFYKLLFTDGAALASLRTTLEEAFKLFSVSKLDEIAAANEIANGGAIMARWVVMFGTFLLLWIVVTIIFKLLKLALKPLAYKDPLFEVDRIIGLFFGIAIGFVVCVIILAVLYLLRDGVHEIDNFLTNTVTPGCLTDKIVYPVAVKLGDYLKALGSFYKTTVVA